MANLASPVGIDQIDQDDVEGSRECSVKSIRVSVDTVVQGRPIDRVASWMKSDAEPN